VINNHDEGRTLLAPVLPYNEKEVKEFLEGIVRRAVEAIENNT
jgi:hypothetical protein